MAKVTVSRNGQRSTGHRSGKPTRLSDTLFGRNLLSQISSLVVAYVSLSVAQLELVRPGQDGCIVLGCHFHFRFPLAVPFALTFFL